MLYSSFGLGHDVGERNRFLKSAVDQSRLAVEPTLGDAESAQDEYSGMVHISTGMTTKDEVEKIELLGAG